MGGGKKSKAPPAPDYAAAAKAQGASDRETAQYLTEANRINQYAPTGSVTWASTYDNNPAARQLQGQIESLQKKISSQSWAPWNLQPMEQQLAALKAQQNKLYGAEKFSQTVSLTPQEQAIFNREQQNRLGMEGLAGTAIGQAGRTIGSQFNPQLRAFMNPQAYQKPGAGIPINTLNSLRDINESDGRFRQQGDQVRDAMYQQMTRFSNERFGEEERNERNRLQQLGLQEGTAAYQNALQEFRRSKDESYQGAQLASILAGGQEQSRLVADQLATRASNIGLRQGQFQQGAGIFGMDQGERQFQAGNQLNLANLAAQQRQQQFGEQSYMRSLPINEISALLGGGGVQMPQMPGFAQATPFQGPDLLGATQAQYGAQMGQYNAGQQQKGGLLGAGAGLLGGFLGGK